ncbi:MAG: M23 family metallopeptidase [Pseudomonadota bacterium]
MRILACAGALTLAQATHALDLRFPVDCDLGDTCFIQNYVDADTSSDYLDYTCNRLSYDGHKGTDVALPAARDMDAGVAVLAAADGTVIGLRDGVPDHLPGEAMRFPEGQDCGNGVVIEHDDGWQTQYCHLAQGSVIVNPGDAVTAGQKLGDIGMSGRTEFPHLHMSVRRDGQVVDPFDPAPDGRCGADPIAQLWQPPLPYEAGRLIQAGFHPGIPDFDAVKIGDAHAATLATEDGALVFWAHLFGTRAGDELRLTITGPQGTFFDNTVTLDRTQAQAFRAGGRRLNAGNTVPGAYEGVARHFRDGQEIGVIRAQTVLE